MSCPLSFCTCPSLASIEHWHGIPFNGIAICKLSSCNSERGGSYRRMWNMTPVRFKEAEVKHAISHGIKMQEVS
jgi:hypothetical protein